MTKIYYEDTKVLLELQINEKVSIYHFPDRSIAAVRDNHMISLKARGHSIIDINTDSKSISIVDSYIIKKNKNIWTIYNSSNEIAAIYNPEDFDNICIGIVSDITGEDLYSWTPQEGLLMSDYIYNISKDFGKEDK